MSKNLLHHKRAIFLSHELLLNCSPTYCCQSYVNMTFNVYCKMWEMIIQWTLIKAPEENYFAEVWRRVTCSSLSNSSPWLLPLPFIPVQKLRVIWADRCWMWLLFLLCLRLGFVCSAHSDGCRWVSSGCFTVKATLYFGQLNGFNGKQLQDVKFALAVT